MTQITEEATLARVLPSVWEVVRTISGLIAAAALAIVVVSTLVLSEPAAVESRTGVPAVQPPAAEPRSAIVIAGPPEQALHVFYLVQTPEQEGIAEWGEYEASMGGEPQNRTYNVLYTRNEEEQAVAGQTILEEMSSKREAVRVDVVDLRPLRASQLH